MALIIRFDSNPEPAASDKSLRVLRFYAGQACDNILQGNRLMKTTTKVTTLAIAALGVMGILAQVAQLPGQQPNAANQVEYFVKIPSSAARGLRLNAPVIMLGQQVGSVTQMDFADDGQGIEASLSISQNRAPDIVIGSRAGIYSSQGILAIAIDRTNNPFGVSFRNGTRGVKAVSVSPTGPADEAGLMVGDELVAMGGREITCISDFAQAVDDVKDLESSKWKVIRENRPKSISVKANFRFLQNPVAQGSAIPWDSMNPAAGGSSVAATASETLGDFQSLYPKIDSNLDQTNEFMVHLGAKTDVLMDDFSTIADRLKKITSQTDSMMETVQGEMEYVPGTMQDAREMMDNMKQMLGNAEFMMSKTSGVIDKVDATVSKTSGVVDKVDSTVSKTSQVVDAVRNQRIINRMVQKNQKRNGFPPQKRTRRRR